MTPQKEQALNEAYEKFMQLNLGNLPLELASDLLAENIMIYGTASDESVFSLKEYVQILSNQREQSKNLAIQGKSKPVFRKISASEDVAIIVTENLLQVLIEDNTHEIFVRRTTVMEYQHEQWRAVHVHTSKPDDVSSKEDTWHIQEWKRKNEELQRLVDEKTADLEHKNRQLEIEAALERVRAEMMAMHKSDELKEVIQLILDQLCGLHFNIDAATFAVDLRESNDFKIWIAAPGQQYASRIHIPYFDHLIFNRFVQAKEKQEDFYTLTYTKEEKNKFFDHFFKYAPVSEERRKVIYSSPGYTQSSVLMKTVALNIFNYAGISYSEEQNNTLKRFGKVFEQTYTRFLDLQKAEAQAKEAQIETALERVRSRSMGMQKSEELREVIQLILDQLCGLNFHIDSASFAVELHESNDLRVWLAAPGQQYASRITLPYFDHPIFNGFVRAKEKQEDFYTQTCTKEEKNAFFDHFLKYVPVTEERRQVFYKANGWALSSMLMKTLALNIQNYAGLPYSEEQNNTLKRFGRVFEQTYTRFLDLQKAEASAKEAVRQASVDRVRAEIASMRTASDLERITPLIWKELSILNVPFIRCGVFIMSEEQQQAHVYLSTPDGKAIAAFQLPFSTTEFIDGVLGHWRKNQIFVDYWDAQKFAEWTKSLLEANLIQKNEKYSAEKPPENLYLQFLPFAQGMLYVGNTAPLTQDDLQLVQSLANAFATAYARYEDFSRLESAKQQIEATLSELKATQSQLIQKEKMASLGELTAGIAHEIQNPLNFVNNFSEVSKELCCELKDELIAGNSEEVQVIAEDLTRNLEKILHHGQRADSIVKGMLQHSRTSSGKKQLTDINALADEYLRLSYHGLRAKNKNFNAALVTDFDSSIGKVEVVPQEIGRVLLNLFNNAFYATQQKKNQLNGLYQQEVKVTTRLLDDTVEIKVRDNGSGIPDNVKSKIFQPFFTTKPTGQGTGLGLSLSYDIITKGHDGELRVETQEGEFAEFIIKLPLGLKM